METWMLVPLAVLVLGVAAVTIGAVVDRRRRARAIETLQSPPNREIPGFTPTDSPRYQLAGHAHQRTTPLSTEPVPRPADRGEAIPYGMASTGLATHRGDVMVLDSPRVLLLSDPATSVRALLTVLAERARAPHALVVVAPEVNNEVVDLLVVNLAQQYLVVGAVAVPDAEGRDRVAALTGATPVDHADLAAGYVPDTSLGHCRRWTSDAERSWILTGDTDDPAVVQE